MHHTVPCGTVTRGSWNYYNAATSQNNPQQKYYNDFTHYSYGNAPVATMVPSGPTHYTTGEFQLYHRHLHQMLQSAEAQIINQSTSKEVAPVFDSPARPIDATPKPVNASQGPINESSRSPKASYCVNRMISRIFALELYLRSPLGETKAAVCAQLPFIISLVH